MRDALLVFAGGGLGSVARFLVGKLYKAWQPHFPFATLTANFLSCLVFGAVIMLGVSRMNLNYSLKLLLITGFCGGFSTYSAFTFETVELFKNGQQGLALSNIVLNFALSVAGLYLGIFAVKSLG
jgi:fluoride exporter